MPPRQSPPPTGSPRRKPGPVMPTSWIWLVVLATFAVGMFIYGPLVMGPGAPIDYSEFIKLIDKKQVSKLAIIGKNRVDGEVKEDARNEEPARNLKLRGGVFTVKIPDTNNQDQLVRDWLAKDPAIKVSWEEERGQWVGPLLLTVLPMVVILGILFLFLMPRIRDPMGGGFLGNYIKSPARRYEKNKGRITFEDVADTENAKLELQEVVDFLRSPEKFQRLGAQVPKGVLLVGPPGTGKTLLARAVAGEAGVPFYSISGSEFIQMFVGVGASRVRDMFKTAKENAPCLLFIDEIDAVGRMRGAGVGGGSDEREQTLNQILSEMDGFQPNEMVIVIAATNRPDVLDSALLRPGRFDRHVTIDRPTWQGRLAILKVHTRTKPLADDVNLELIARKMVGMTGADLRNLANEAALIGTREGKSRIDRHDFEKATDRVLRGPKREEILTAEEKKRTAYHEAGHALVTWLVPHADRPIKVSIIPRGRSLGVNLLLPEHERVDIGLDALKAQLVTAMGGRAADRLIFNQPFAGAESDLKQATRMARYMVTHWGMSDRLGPMSFRIGEEHVFLGKEIQEPRDFSEGTAQIIDEEVQKLLREADTRAFDLLSANRNDLERITEALLQREELTRDDLDELLRDNANIIKNGRKNDDPSKDGMIIAPGTAGGLGQPVAG